MKTSYLYIKISLVLLFFFISISPLSALYFPSGFPTGQIQNGKIQETLTNIFGDCGAGKYIQGFNSAGVADCKSVASFTTLTLAVGHPNTTLGSGLFQKYFTKILNDCGAGRYARGFDSNKNLICEDVAKTFTLMGTATSLVSPVSVSFPLKPTGQSLGGTFTDSFNTIFAIDCGAGKYLQGFNTTTKAPICAPIVTIITISNCTELQNIGTSTTTLAGKYQLAHDIDCSDTINWNGGLGFKQIGHNSDLFIGTLDGKGYKVTGLYINRPLEDYIGLFGFSFSNSIIKNIGVDGANIIGRNQVGGLIGNPDTSSITNSYTTNSAIKGIQNVGGLAGGCAGSSISSSYATNNTINGSYYIGGLASGGNHCQISNSYATNNTINGSSQIGGLVGYNIFTPISNSYATNNAISGMYSLGGLVGNNSASSISSSYAINNSITGNQGIGGLVGDNYYDWGPAPISNSYATNNTISEGSSYIGGLVGGGSLLSTSTASYYNKDTFTGATLYGTPETTGEMVLQGIYSGWDFSADWKPMTGALTGYYPCLAWQTNDTCTKVVDLQPPTITQVRSISNTCNSVMGKIDGYADNYMLNSTPYSFDGGVSWDSSPYFIPPLDYSSTYQLTYSSYTIAANKLKVRDAAGNIYSNPADIILSTDCIVSPEYGPFTFTEATTQCTSLGAGWHVPKWQDFLMGFWNCTQKPSSGGINCKYPSSFTSGNIYWGSEDIHANLNIYKEVFSPGKGWNGFEAVFPNYSYSQTTGPVLAGYYGSSGNMMLRCVKYNNPIIPY